MNDAQLVRGALLGEEECLLELLRRHRRSVYTWIRHRGIAGPDAEDLTQETLICAVRKLKLYDPDKGTFQNWLLGIAEHMCLRFWRNIRRDPCVASVDALAEEPTCVGPAESYDRCQSEDVLWRAVSGLPLKLRTVVVMFFYWGMNRTEVAHFLGVTEGTVRYRLRIACTMMRHNLAAQGLRQPSQIPL